MAATLGLSLCRASAANAQGMTLTSAGLKEGATIANEQVFKGFGCTRELAKAKPMYIL